MKKYYWLIFLLVNTILISLIWFAFKQSDEVKEQQVISKVKDQIQLAVLQCYALEGQYPESIEYLTDAYQLKMNTDAYHVFYNNNGANIMPDIDVVKKK